jgi:hypothetical protein
MGKAVGFITVHLALLKEQCTLLVLHVSHLGGYNKQDNHWKEYPRTFGGSTSRASIAIIDPKKFGAWETLV